MASLLGVHRITLYKVLRQQEEQGLFGPFERHAVTILRPEEFFAWSIRNRKTSPHILV